MDHAPVDTTLIDPDDPRAQYCLELYVNELNRRFEAGWDPSKSISAAADELRLPAGIFLLASMGEKPMGCVALKFRGDETAEIKRMWVIGWILRGRPLQRRTLRTPLVREADRRRCDIGTSCLGVTSSWVKALSLLKLVRQHTRQFHRVERRTRRSPRRCAPTTARAR